jgi:hypothetical protein
MKIEKFGETYFIKDDTKDYVLSGDLIKTVQGNFIINICTYTKDDVHITTMTGEYRPEEDVIHYDFRTKITEYDQQAEIVHIVISTIKSLV